MIINKSYNHSTRTASSVYKAGGQIQTNTEPIILWEFLSSEKGQLLTVLNKLTFIKKNAGQGGRKEGKEYLFILYEGNNPPPGICPRILTLTPSSHVPTPHNVQEKSSLSLNWILKIFSSPKKKILNSKTDFIEKTKNWNVSIYWKE